MRPKESFPGGLDGEGGGGDNDGNDREGYASDEDRSLDEGVIADLQAGHSVRVAGLVYARSLSEAPGVILEKRAMFRASSEA